MFKKTIIIIFICGLFLTSCRILPKPIGWTMLETKSSPPKSHAGAVAYMNASENAVFFGGSSTDKWLDETWIWDGKNWSQVYPANRPPAREKLAMAYDESRDRIVLFGGIKDKTLFDDTWEWDGQDWHLIVPKHKPLPRCCHAMAYDSVQQKVILYAGDDPIQNNFLSDAWIWDGTDWTEVTCCDIPPMSGHTMTNFNSKNEVVSVQTADLGTWVWDGHTWKDLAIENPPHRADGRIAYDRKHNRAVFFAGSQDGQRLSDTWIFDGEKWQQLFFSINPTACSGHILFYDTKRQSVILFGGYGNDGWLNDTWELNLPTDLPSVTATP